MALYDDGSRLDERMDSRMDAHDPDDSVSSSDGSFMPPVLSTYANELLFDKENPHLARTSRSGGSRGHTRAEPDRSTSPIGSSSSARAAATPGFRTGSGFTRAPAADMTTARSTMRLKRLGKFPSSGLTKPLARQQFEPASTSNGLGSAASSAFSSDPVTSSYSPLSRSSKIRFASDNQEIPNTNNSPGSPNVSNSSASSATTPYPAKSDSLVDSLYRRTQPSSSSSSSVSSHSSHSSISSRNRALLSKDEHLNSKYLYDSKTPSRLKDYHLATTGNESMGLSDPSNRQGISERAERNSPVFCEIPRDTHSHSSALAGHASSNNLHGDINGSNDRQPERRDSPRHDSLRHDSRYDSNRNDSLRSDSNRHDSLRSDSNRHDSLRSDSNRQESIRDGLRGEMRTTGLQQRMALQNLSPNVVTSRFAGAKIGKTPPPKLEQWGTGAQKEGPFFEARAAPPPPVDTGIRQIMAEAPRQVSVPTGQKKKNMMAINGRLYQRLELIGRGGSSKVYKASSNDGKVFAVKKVTFEDVDEAVIEGFKGEIDLLQRLRNEDRVVKLVDHEMLETSVYVVMECGEIDLAHVLANRLNSALDVPFVRYYATEMLKCVAAVHAHGIVHSDLKPANFLLVKGMLKIIDFGIANVVPDYTANIHRDTQIGTPNYMAPEALLDANQFAGPATGAKFKVGKPSDVWSCGCIIYQMLYGKPPYAAYNGTQRMLAIMNPKIQIQYPKTGLGQVRVPREAIEALRACLNRDANARATIQQILDGSFLNPQSIDKSFITSLLEHAVRYGAERKETPSLREIETLADDVWEKVQMLNRA